MYVLYLDESGNPDSAADRHFVLGGVAVFEHASFFLSRDLDALQQRHFPGTPPVDFHASHIKSGKDFWRDVSRETRDNVLMDVGNVLVRSKQPEVVLFASVVTKSPSLFGEDAVKQAFEDICSRFDILLQRRFHEQSDAQRGLVILAESQYHQRTRLWLRAFREFGTRWGRLNNFADIPYAAPAKETRLLQLADFVSHSTYCLYEKRDSTHIAPLVWRFDHKDGRIHGLSHVCDRRPICECPFCHSRRNPGRAGPWVS